MVDADSLLSYEATGNHVRIFLSEYFRNKTKLPPLSAELRDWPNQLPAPYERAMSAVKEAIRPFFISTSRFRELLYGVAAEAGLLEK